MSTGGTLGQRFDALIAEMDAAYAERRKHEPYSPLYVAADAMVDQAYANLRALKSELATRTSVGYQDAIVA